MYSLALALLRLTSFRSRTNPDFSVLVVIYQVNDNALVTDECFLEYIKVQYITEITNSCSLHGSYHKHLVETIYEFIFDTQD